MKKINKKNELSPNEQKFIDYELSYADGALGPKAAFTQEVAYQRTIEETLEVPLYNKIYGNLLYGKVDKKLNSIAPQGIYVNKIEGVQTEESALAFVGDAYKDFLSKWSKFVNIGAASEDFFSLNVTKGYQNIEDVYSSYLMEHYNGFQTYLDGYKLKNQIIDFKSFMKMFFEYCYLQSRTSSFSLSKFIKTKKCPDSITGLVLYLENKKNTYSNKVEYINNKDFALLQETLFSYGFIMDKNEPWKIHFNIYSSFSKKYIDAYGDSNKIYETFFTKVNSYDLFYLQKIIFEMYNDFTDKNDTFLETSYKKCNNEMVAKKVIKRRNPLSQEEIGRRLSSKIETEWWKFYIYIRILEERKNAGQEIADSLVSQTVQIYQKLDIEPALRYLERKIAEMPAEIRERKKLKL